MKVYIQLLSETDEIKKYAAKDIIENASIKWTGPIHAMGEVLIDNSIENSTCDSPALFSIKPIVNSFELKGVGQLSRAKFAIESL